MMGTLVVKGLKLHKFDRLNCIWKLGFENPEAVAYRNFAKFTGKYLRQTLFFNTVAGGAWRRCFPVNFAKFLRTHFLQNTSGGCLWKFKLRIQFSIKFLRILDEFSKYIAQDDMDWLLVSRSAYLKSTSSPTGFFFKKKKKQVVDLIV